MALGVSRPIPGSAKASLPAPPLPPAPRVFGNFCSFLPSQNRLQNQALKRLAKVAKWSPNGCPNRHQNLTKCMPDPSKSRSRTGLRTKRPQTLKMHTVVHFGMIFQGPRLAKCLSKHLPKSSQTAKHAIKSRAGKHMKTHAEKSRSSFQKYPKREPISEPCAVFFMSFRVWVRLLPPSWHPRWPRSTKACQNHQKTHLEHAKLVKKRTLQDHVSGGPEPDNSCPWLFFFLAPLAHQPQPEQ